jgi:hypothetical protein
LASAAEARTCRDGKTVYQQAGVRVFSQDGGFWACGKATRRPVHLASFTGPYGSFKVLGRRSGRVIFVFEFSGEGGGEDTSVGWFDGRRARAGQLAGRVSNEVLDVVVATNGGMGVVSSLGEDAGVRVGYLAPGRDELVLATIGGRYAQRSLAFTTGGLRWRSADGQTRTVALTGEPLSCTAGTTVLEHEGARLFEVFKGDRDRLAACRPGDATPRILASTSVGDQDPWKVDSVKRAGSRVAFLANDRIGLLDALTITVMRPPGYDALDDIALATAGPPAFASQGHVLRLRHDPARHDGLRVFEGIVAHAIRLFGCATGATTPLELWQGGRGSKVFELAHEHGLIARDGVLVFGERVVLRGTPGPSQAYGNIRDAAIAPDGRLALALRDGKRWLITAFTTAGKERVVARPRDGVTWTNDEFRPRSAPHSSGPLIVRGEMEARSPVASVRSGLPGGTKRERPGHLQAAHQEHGPAAHGSYSKTATFTLSTTQP